MEATLENAEVLVDAMLENPAVASIPVVGTAIKVCKGIDDLRTRAFAAKLSRFVSQLEPNSQETREEIQRLVAASPDEMQKVGETLFLVLDRFIDLDKPRLLSQVFLAYLRGRLSAEQLTRLAQAIDAAVSHDLAALLAAKEQLVMGRPVDSHEYPWIETLIPSGLSINVARGVGVVEMSCEITSLGRLLWRVNDEFPPKH